MPVDVIDIVLDLKGTAACTLKLRDSLVHFSCHPSLALNDISLAL